MWDDRAAIYDLFTTEEDIPFYSGLAMEAGGPVLEVGCGTGRLLFPLAEAGFDCVGIDSSIEMLNRCRDRLSTGRQIDKRLILRHQNWIEEASSQQAERDHYGFVLFGFGMIGLFWRDGEAKKALELAAAALRPGGLLVVDRRNWMADRYHAFREFDWIKRWPDRSAVVCQSHTDVIVDPVRRIRQAIYYYDGISADGAAFAFSHEMYLREFSVLELRELLASAGLTVVQSFGDYDRRPFSPSEPRIILTATKPG
jgi:SAM-dependent methyltransferase